MYLPPPIPRLGVPAAWAEGGTPSGVIHKSLPVVKRTRRAARGLRTEAMVTPTKVSTSRTATSPPTVPPQELHPGLKRPSQSLCVAGGDRRHAEDDPDRRGCQRGKTNAPAGLCGKGRRRLGVASREQRANCRSALPIAVQNVAPERRAHHGVSAHITALPCALWRSERHIRMLNHRAIWALGRLAMWFTAGQAAVRDLGGPGPLLQMCRYVRRQPGPRRSFGRDVLC